MTNHSTVFLERVPGNPPDLNSSELSELALLYARVFAGEPWNEYTYCETEDRFFGRDTQEGQVCLTPNCKTSLRPAYPLDQTAEYILNELARSDSALFLLRDNARTKRIVGFSWGFSYPDSEEFANDKYSTSSMRLVIGSLLKRLNTGNGGLWYLSESGIENDPQYRGQGWSMLFHKKRLAVAEALGMDAVQRTSCYGNMYRTSVKTMLQVMGPQMAIDSLTRQLKPTGTVINGLADDENSQRVLFAKFNQV